jgi:SAM-dependent methyltransferase
MPPTRLAPCPACGSPDADPVAASPDSLHVLACRGCGRLRGHSQHIDLPESPSDPVGFAAVLVGRHALSADDLVIEIGSGTGGRLRAVRRLGPRVLGIEPQLREMARAFHAGVDTIGALFGSGVAEYVARRYGLARVLIVRDLRAVGCDPAVLLATAAGCLTPDGVVVAEVLVGDTARMIELAPTRLPAAVPAAA